MPPPPLRPLPFFTSSSIPNSPLISLRPTAAAQLNNKHDTVYISDEGTCMLIDKKGEMKHTWKSHRRAYHIKAIREYVVIVGEDEDTVPVLKVFNVQTKTCIKTVKIHQGKAYPVTSIAVDEINPQIAIGLSNGTVIHIKGDITRDRFLKQRVIHEHEQNVPITGIAFRQWAGDTVLYITTPNSVILWNGKEKDHLDNIGAGPNCVVATEPDNNVMIGRTEGIYYYTPEGRGPCFAFQGDKIFIMWYRAYLVVASHSRESFVLSVYDLANKFIAHEETFDHPIRLVSAEWASLIVILGDGTVWRMAEKDSQTKLDLLFKKNLYGVAINLALNTHDMGSIADIRRKHGDHLFSKGDHDGALQQYIQTIGTVEPFYVISKYLDSSKIDNLTAYLAALQSSGLANGDHLTLLLNCYAKLKKRKDIESFIMNSEAPTYNVRNAIEILREAELYDEALSLAMKSREHDSYLQIVIQDTNRYSQGLEYIETLGLSACDQYIQKYSQVLLEALPEETTSFLIKFSCQKSKRGDADLTTPAESFIPIFASQPKWLKVFLERIVEQQPVGASCQIWNALLELYLKEHANPSNDPEDSSVSHAHEVSKVDKTLDLLKNREANYDTDHALILCKMYKYDPGTIFLYAKLKMYKEIMQYRMAEANYDQVLACCRIYGDKEPTLWADALAYFADRETDCSANLTEVLNSVEKFRLLPLLDVIKILSNSATCSLGIIRDFISRSVSAEMMMIEEDEKMIRSYQEETEKMKQEIRELQDGPRFFQPSNCTACQAPIDVPSTHFLCRHSYHTRCLGDSLECTECAPENTTLMEIRRSQEQTSMQHDQFFRQLEGSTDGFFVIAEYFGRNAFQLPST